MTPCLSEHDRQRLARVAGVFLDIDDTLSTRGKLTAAAYAALWRLHDAGLRVVPVTGRPAGWCDHIARFWPVDAVVGENGGFYFSHDGKKLYRRFLYSDAQRAEFRRRLLEVKATILREVPGCAVASEQPYREYDLAIDFCEDVPPLPRDAILRIQQLFLAAGARAKISSIHVNGWYGDFDKLSSTRLCARELWGVELEAERDHYVFCGDSPNDEPMFAFFPLSFGMANLSRFIDLLSHRPAWITEGECGARFCQVADLLCRPR